MSQVINKFDGVFGFLSNFEPSIIIYEGLVYPTIEHAFQAAKTLDKSKRMEIKKASTPGIAKKMGRSLKLRDDWETIKISVMTELVRKKFLYIDHLKVGLIATGSAELIEGNTWNDTFWGVCNGNGSNNLGKILMQVRAELQPEIQSEENKRRNVLDI